MGASDEMRQFYALLGAVSCCDIFEADPSGNSVSVYDHISYFFDECGQGAAAQSVKTILPLVDTILPDGYYRSWNQPGVNIYTFDKYFMYAYPVSDFTRERLETWHRFLDLGNDDTTSLETIWYEILRFSYEFPPKFKQIQDGNFDYTLKEFGYKDYEGESSGLRGYGYRFYANQFFPKFVDNTVINNMEQFILLGWPVYALTVSIGEGAWEQTGWHLLNILTQFSAEILTEYYSTLRGSFELLIARLTTAVDIISGSGTAWDRISNSAFSVHEALSRMHEISRVFISMAVDLDYQMRYAQNVFKYAEGLANNIPLVRNIFNGLMTLSDQVGETLTELLNIEISGNTFEDYLVAQYEFFASVDQKLLQVTSLTYLTLLPARIADVVINPEDNGLVTVISAIVDMVNSGSTGNGTVV